MKGERLCHQELKGQYVEFLHISSFKLTSSLDQFFDAFVLMFCSFFQSLMRFSLLGCGGLAAAAPSLLYDMAHAPAVDVGENMEGNSKEENSWVTIKTV